MQGGEVVGLSGEERVKGSEIETDISACALFYYWVGRLCVMLSHKDTTLVIILKEEVDCKRLAGLEHRQAAAVTVHGLNMC